MSINTVRQMMQVLFEMIRHKTSVGELEFVSLKKNLKINFKKNISNTIALQGVMIILINI